MRGLLSNKGQKNRARVSCCPLAWPFTQARHARLHGRAIIKHYEWGRQESSCLKVNLTQNHCCGNTIWRYIWRKWRKYIESDNWRVFWIVVRSVSLSVCVLIYMWEVWFTLWKRTQESKNWFVLYWNVIDAWNCQFSLYQCVANIFSAQTDYHFKQVWKNLYWWLFSSVVLSH